MSLRIVITAPARMEIAQAVKYYEEQRPSAGVKFWIEFKNLAKRLRTFQNSIRDSENVEFEKLKCIFTRMRSITELPETNCAYWVSCMAR